MSSGLALSAAGVPSKTTSPLTRITMRSAIAVTRGHGLVDDEGGHAGGADQADRPPDLVADDAAPGLRWPRRGSAGAGWSAARGRWPASAARRPRAGRRDWPAARPSRGNSSSTRVDCPAAPAVVAGPLGDRQVLAHAQAGEDAAALGHVGDAAAGDGEGRQPVTSCAVDQHRARARGRTSPTSVRISVVLPMPLRPIRPMVSPAPIAIETPRRTWLWP